MIVQIVQSIVHAHVIFRYLTSGHDIFSQQWILLHAGHTPFIRRNDKDMNGNVRRNDKDMNGNVRRNDKDMNGNVSVEVKYQVLYTLYV